MTACARDGDILPPFNPGDLNGGLYASVPFSQRSAVDALGVEYEVLENLFIPDEDKDFVENSETRAVAMRLDASFYIRIHEREPRGADAIIIGTCRYGSGRSFYL